MRWHRWPHFRSGSPRKRKVVLRGKTEILPSAEMSQCDCCVAGRIVLQVFSCRIFLLKPTAAMIEVPTNVAPSRTSGEFRLAWP